jgi:hypothetical protein
MFHVFRVNSSPSHLVTIMHAISPITIFGIIKHTILCISFSHGLKLIAFDNALLKYRTNVQKYRTGQFH